ncbi:hypothetical protein [uncultured Roseibium sp.]|uniref:hypothetical protein n=1 Tax=uncultured Roseibium sp. TaxID=1936171 RepID=UPI002637A293|nr:hypothetical protein [uncultured Roseibium sp.]
MAVLDRQDEDLQDEFLISFDTLPEAVQTAIFSELSLGGAGLVKQASDAEMVEFAKSEEGAELIAGWGSLASRNVTKVFNAVRRITNSLSASELESLWSWFEYQDSATAIAILWTLAR